MVFWKKPYQPDPVAVELACAGERRRLHRDELAAAIARLDTGYRSARQIAERLGVAERTVTRSRAARRELSTRDAQFPQGYPHGFGTDVPQAEPGNVDDKSGRDLKVVDV